MCLICVLKGLRLCEVISSSGEEINWADCYEQKRDEDGKHSKWKGLGYGISNDMIRT